MSLNQRKIKKLDKKEIDALKNRGANKALECKKCKKLVENVAFDVYSVICSYCVQQMSAPPSNYISSTDSKEKRPRGWQFQTKYISPSGKIYHKGREVDESFFNDTKAVEGRKDKISKESPAPKKRGRPPGRKNSSGATKGNTVNVPRKNEKGSVRKSKTNK